MILNATHAITLRGMPSDIQDAYVRYKKGSRAILSWLLQFGPEHYKGTKRLPIKGLSLLAKAVIHSITDLPEVIHFHFRETIAARKRLSKYFRTSIDSTDDDTNTANHEHFTTSLTKIYLELCDHCQNHRKEQRANTSHPSALPKPIRNHYACLSIEESVGRLELETRDTACDECHHEPTYQCPGPRIEVELENDEMSTAIETASNLERIHEVLASVESSWRQAAQTQTHFISAAGVTNVAWSALQELEARLRGEDGNLSISELHQRCCVFRTPATEPNGTLSKVHALLDSLLEADRAISHYSNCHKLTVRAHCPSCIQRPSEYTQTTDTTEGGQTTSFAFSLMKNILLLMCGNGSTPNLIQGSPVFAQIGHLLAHRDDNPTSFRCVLGLHLLTVTYKAYLYALARPATISLCRIKALKLSKQAASAIDSILRDKDSFPCRCTETLGFHLSNLGNDMDAYSRHKCWDLYFQSPWTAGNHMIGMLDMLSYYGMRLFNYRHYIGALLHSYNVLIQHSGLETIPILESVCDIFKDVFFPSGRPTSHFKNSWARYIGARLKFKKGHKRHGNDRDNWCMAVPAHAAKTAAGLSIDKQGHGVEIDTKYDYAHIDPMIKLKQQEWRIDLTSEADRTPQSVSPSASRPGSSSSSSDPPNGTSIESNIASDPFQTLQTTLTTSLNHTTTLNHISLYAKSTSLIRSATAKLHTAPADQSSANLCICFVHTLLAGADRIVEGRKFGGLECWKKEEREVVSVIGELLKETFVGIEWSDLCWEI